MLDWLGLAYVLRGGGQLRMWEGFIMYVDKDRYAGWPGHIM